MSIRRGALIIGAVAGVVCLFAATTLKNMLGYDDSLDVFGVHAVGGIVGAVLTGVLAKEAIGGTAGSMDQVITQLYGIAWTIGYCAVATFALLMIVKVLVGLRADEETEREGLDINLHGETVA